MRVYLDKPASYRTRDAKRRVILNYLTAGILTTWRQLPNDMWYLIERAHTLAAMPGAIFSWSFLIWLGAISWSQQNGTTLRVSCARADGGTSRRWLLFFSRSARSTSHSSPCTGQDDLSNRRRLSSMRGPSWVWVGVSSLALSFSGDLLVYFLHLWASFLSPTYRMGRGRRVFPCRGGGRGCTMVKTTDEAVGWYFLGIYCGRHAATADRVGGVEGETGPVSRSVVFPKISWANVLIQAYTC